MRPFKAEHYYRVSLERMGQAHLLYRERNSFALCMYVAGLAVECMLLAFKARVDDTFDEKHDLRRLFRSSGLHNVGLGDSERSEQVGKYHRELQLAVENVYVLWSNDFRFASEDRLRSHLKKQEGLRREVKGDILKAAAFRLVHSSQQIVSRGTQLWRPA